MCEEGQTNTFVLGRRTMGQIGTRAILQRQFKARRQTTSRMYQDLHSFYACIFLRSDGQRLDDFKCGSCVINFKTPTLTLTSLPVKSLNKSYIKTSELQNWFTQIQNSISINIIYEHDKIGCNPKIPNRLEKRLGKSQKKISAIN